MKSEEQRAEEEGEQKFLSDATLALTSSLDIETTLNRVAEIATVSLADWCVVSLIEVGGKRRRVARVHKDPQRIRWAMELERRYPPEEYPDEPEAFVIRTGQPFLLQEITRELLQAHARDSEHLRLIEEAEIRSAFIVPIKANEEVIGTISFISSIPGRYDERSVAVAQELANRASLGIQNARLFSKYEQLAQELEERVRVRTQELEQANRELEAFSYSVSHDLRAPLRTISSFSKLLLLDHSHQLDDEGKKTLGRIEEASKRMAKLIDDLLRYARLSRAAIRPERVDLAVIANSVREELARKEPDRNVAFSISGPLVVKGDRDLLRVVMENLIENAWKFAAKTEKACIEVGALHKDGIRTFYVRDNGAGFDMKYANKLFKPFERLHAEVDFAGTGIGLVNVQRILQRHGGRIWAAAAPGKGATFYFTLA